MSNYEKYKESHLKAQKKYDDKNREKKHKYDKERWEKRKREHQSILELKGFIKEYEKNRNCFKWNEQDYIDVIDKIKEIIGGDK